MFFFVCLSSLFFFYLLFQGLVWTFVFRLLFLFSMFLPVSSFVVCFLLCVSMLFFSRLF